MSDRRAPIPRADLSVLTLVRNRNDLLAGLVDALARSEVAPDELVVAWCGGEDPGAVLDRPLPFDVRVVEVDDHDRIVYSKARNGAAAAARASGLAFIDADCVPSATYVGALAAALDEHDALCTGEVLYLPPELPDRFDETDLRRLGRPHPHRERPPATGVALGGRHELVWGLHLALRASTFSALGGFDEGYTGYAGEDTDLAVTARAAGIPVGLVAGAEVFHQHHDVWEPPVQQLAATLANASRFRDKWGRWPMEGWLTDLAELGLIEWSPAAPTARLVREPTEADLAAAHRTSALPFRDAAPTSA